MFLVPWYSPISRQVFHCATCQQDLCFPSFVRVARWVPNYLSRKVIVLDAALGDVTRAAIEGRHDASKALLRQYNCNQDWRHGPSVIEMSSWTYRGRDRLHVGLFQRCIPKFELEWEEGESQLQWKCEPLSFRKNHLSSHVVLISPYWHTMPLILVNLTNRLNKAIPIMNLLHWHGSSIISRHINVPLTLSTSSFGASILLPTT